MRRQIIFLVLVVSAFFGGNCSAQNTFVREGNDLVVYEQPKPVQPNEVERYKGLLANIQKDELSDEAILEFVTGKRTELIKFGEKKMVRINHRTFPMEIGYESTQTRYTLSGGQIVPEKLPTQIVWEKDKVLDFCWRIFVFLCVATVAFISVTHKKYLVFCGALFVGLLAGGFAGVLAGVFAGVLAGAFAGGLAGGFIRELGYTNAGINDYLAFLVVAMLVAWVLARLAHFTINRFRSLKQRVNKEVEDLGI